MQKRLSVGLLLAACFMASAGCGGPATFVSPDAPPDTNADAWFASGVPKVRSALQQAMMETGLVPGVGPAGVVVGKKPQLPYVDEESGEPASGPLPVYELRATLTRPGETRVHVVLHVSCAACNGRTPYEWEYPGDVIRKVLERTKRILRESRTRFEYPVRYRPPPWHRPRHR